MNRTEVYATYLIETPHSVEQAADMIAGEQSSGTFVSVPGETEDLKARHRARVVSVEPLAAVEVPALPGSRMKASPGSLSRYQRAKVQIAFPLDNIGYNLPTLMATICGNLYELSQLSGCKLIDLDMPTELASRYPGPQFGISGTRRLTNVYDRPLIGTIIKPSVGLSPAQTASLVRELCQAGIDFIKDDELMANPPHSPLQQRVDAVMSEIRRHRDQTGRQVMYACNLSDEIDAMRRHHDYILDAGGSCVMASLNQVGLTGITALRAHSQLPIHGHRNGWGMLTRHPLLGIDFRAYQKIWRAVGVDQLHCNGLDNKFWEPDDSVVASIKALSEPMWGGYQALPVISSGQTGLQAPETFRQGGTLDLLYLAGGGIMAHPSGIAGGVRAVQQAWEAARLKVDLQVYAQSHLELRQSLEKFGGKS